MPAARRRCAWTRRVPADAGFRRAGVSSDGERAARDALAARRQPALRQSPRISTCASASVVGVGDGQERRAAADGREAPPGAAVKLQLRRTAVADDLDVAPQHATRVAGAERLHRRFLGGEASGKMDGRLAPPLAVRDFAVGEDPMQEPVAVALDVAAMRGMSVASRPRPMMFGMMSTDDTAAQPSDRFEWAAIAGGRGRWRSCAVRSQPLAHHLFTTRRVALGSGAGGADALGEVAAALGAESTGPSACASIRSTARASSCIARAAAGRRAADADIIVGRRCVASPWPFRRQTACRCSLPTGAPARSPPRMPGGAAWRRASPARPSTRLRTSSAAGRVGSHRRDRTVDRRRAAMKSAARCASGSRTRDSAAASSRAGSPTSRAISPQSVDATGARRPDHWFFDRWASRGISWRRRAFPRDRIFVADLCTASHADFLLVSPRRRRPAVGIARGAQVFRRGVHGRVRQPIGVRVRVAADVLEGDAADLVGEQPRLGVQRLQARMLTL